MFVCDNFLKDEDLILNIKASKDFFPEDMGDVDNIGGYNNHFHSGESTCYAPYMFWDGWWASPTNTLRKKVIRSIWENCQFFDIEQSEICGFEYWCRTFRPGQYLRIHVDEDTFAYENDRTFNAPAYGAIWYGFTECGDGGFLEIHEGKIIGSPQNALEIKNIEKLKSTPEKRERLSYKPNRLISFDAGRRLHETTPTNSGIRQVMVINVWHKDSPPRALQTGQFFYE